MLATPTVIDAAEFDQTIPEAPNTEGVFVVWAGDRSAYIAKTSMLRRRLLRILKPLDGPPSRGLNLRAVATRVDYWLTGSRFESGLVHYELARRQYPDSYLELIKLRMPAYVLLILANEFPRTQVVSRLGSRQSLHYGPFRTRAAAELFETQMLDLFQLRRCQEDLAPRPEHPGCVYGEMGMCLRPCQELVNASEYRSEAERVAEFLSTGGRLMAHRIEGARDRLSGEMNFEEAARQHKRLERVNLVLAMPGELVSDIDRLYGVAILPSGDPDVVRLWFVYQGCWQPPYDFRLKSGESLDRRLRELTAGLQPVLRPRQERQEHLALLARWYYSSWRDGEWIQFESLALAPYRRLVRAISRVHGAAVKAGQETSA